MSGGTKGPFSQHPYRCRLDWGARGASDAAARGDIVVIVDVLSFSTAVATAVARGAIVYPCGLEADAGALARAAGAQVAVGRDDVPARGRYSLSPATFDVAQRGERIVLPSLNGGLCCENAAGAPRVYAGALVNAGAVATAVSRALAEDTRLNATVIACGERWGGTAAGELVVAVEDYLGAGAIVSGIVAEPSPEARVCAGAFAQAREELASLLAECGSGRELRLRGAGDDVERAGRLDALAAVPLLRGGRFEEA